MNKRRILCVDDDSSVLSAMRRQLYRDFEVHVALGPDNGLKAVRDFGGYEIILSDLRMPIMDGLEFLRQVRDLSPETIRIMLTGHADVDVAIRAINDGAVFRFLTKPCSEEMLLASIQLGLRQYDLQHAERELLDQTLRGAVRMLTDVLSVANPTAFGRASRIGRLVRKLADQLRLEDTWKLDVAAMLSQIGCITVPEEILRRHYAGKELDVRELEIFRKHAGMAQELMEHIPRLEDIGAIIANQDKRFDGDGEPQNGLAGDAIPLGSRLLKLALDYDTLISGGLSADEALAKIILRDRAWYDPALIFALKQAVASDIDYETITIKVDDLKVGLIIAEDVYGNSGVLIIPKGQEINSSLLARLRNYAAMAGIKNSIKVLLPVARVPAQ